MSRLTWLDKGIGWIAPGWGARRAQHRSVMLAYDAAQKGRRTEGWRTSGGSADAEVTRTLGVMRDRARDLVRNNPHAAKALGVIVSNKIGTGVMTQAAGPNKRMNRRIDERWKRWIDNCDAAGKLDLYGIQSLAERTRAESGEALIRFERIVIDDIDDVPLRLKVMEPDLIDQSRNTIDRDTGNVIRDGIEYRGSVPVAYYLFPTHPGDATINMLRSGGFQSLRVPAGDILHYYKVQRPGQSRGITDFAPVIIRLRALDDYDDAEVMRKKVAACLAAFVTTPAGLPGASIAPTTLDADGNSIEQFRPGLVGYLKPGEAVTTFDPAASGDYQPFNLVQLRAIASGLGIPYELLSGDLSNVNYSSLRGGMVQFGISVEADQWQTIVPQLCRPIWRRFLAEAPEAFDVSTPATHTPPRFILLDPAKEVPAMIDAIKGGLMTWGNTVRREGYDPGEQLDQIEAEQKEFAKRGIVLTSDPRTEQKQQAEATPAKPAPMTPEGTDDARAA